jgi:hypothetical protein
MLCPNCATEITEGHTFCGKCGKNAFLTLHDLHKTISGLEDQMGNMQKLDQQRLEIDTTKNIKKQLEDWAKSVLFWGTVLVGVIGLIAAFIWGKGEYDLHSLIAKAHDTVEVVLKKAQSEATSAKATADSASQTATQVNSEIQSTKRDLDKLRNEVAERNKEVEGLNKQVQGVAASLEATKQKVSQVTQQLQTTNREKEINDIKARNPALYGDREVRSPYQGVIDRKQKPPYATWVLMGAFQDMYRKPIFSPEALQAANEAVRTRATLWENAAMLIAAGPNGGGQSLGTNIDSYICTNGGLDTGFKEPPCILYFDEAGRTKALEIRNVLKQTQFIPDDKVKYIPVAKMTENYKKIIELSGLDMVVVIGKLNQPN